MDRKAKLKVNLSSSVINWRRVCWYCKLLWRVQTLINGVK